jgi:multicomponent K+:H+ antiporter subunit E
MSAFLLVVWLLLNQTVSPGHIVLGGVIAIVGGWVMSAVEPPEGRPRRPLVILQLSLDVLADIFRSNVAVAGIILGLGKPSAPGFVRIPLDMRSQYGLAALAVIITATPGTVWVNYDAGEGILTIHVLDLDEESAWIRTIKHRYERGLMEIFE